MADRDVTAMTLGFLIPNFAGELSHGEAEEVAIPSAAVRRLTRCRPVAVDAATDGSSFAGGGGRRDPCCLLLQTILVSTRAHFSRDFFPAPSALAGFNPRRQQKNKRKKEKKVGIDRTSTLGAPLLLRADLLITPYS